MHSITEPLPNGKGVQLVIRDEYAHDEISALVVQIVTMSGLSPDKVDEIGRKLIAIADIRLTR